jgi:hypothetical protein
MLRRLALLLAALALPSVAQAQLCGGSICYFQAGVPLTGSLGGFRAYIPDQVDLLGSFAVGTGGANLTYAAGGDCQSDPLGGSDPWNGKYNTFFGIKAGDATTCGAGNTFVGYLAGEVNTIGSQNTFVGWSAGEDNTTGYHNTFLGVGAGQRNIAGYYNTYVGSDAALIATGGYSNVFVGTSAGTGHTTGTKNIFVGAQSGQVNGTGADNVGIGHLTLGAAASQSQNVAIGAWAGEYETAGRKLFIDSIDRSTEAFGRTKSLVYGIFYSDPARQNITFNASTITNGSLAFPLVADATIQFGQTVMPDAGTDGRFDVTTGSATLSIGVLGSDLGGYGTPSAAGTAQQVIYGGLAYVAIAEDLAVTRGHYLLQSATAGYCSDSATVSTDGLNIAKALRSEAVTNVIAFNGCTGGAGCVNTALNTPNVGAAGQITLSADVAAAGWVVGEPVVYWNSGGTSIAGLTDGKVYFLKTVSGANVTIAPSTVNAAVIPTSQGDDATQYLQRLPLAAVSIQ